MAPNLSDAGGAFGPFGCAYDRCVTVDSPVRRPAAYAPLRLAITALVVVAVIALGIVAGLWQWGRYETRSHALALQEAAESAPVVDVAQAISPDDADAGDAEWRTVTATGVLEADSLTEIRGRSVDNRATIQYVTWLRLESGTGLLVNLGYAPRSDDAQQPSLPAGEVTVTGVVRNLEPDNDRAGTRIAPTQVGSIDGEVLPAYLMVSEACGDAGCVEGLTPVPPPSLSLGPHLSYALQWWLLAVVATPLAIAFTRRDARLEREAALEGDDAPSATPEPEAEAGGAPEAPAQPERRRGRMSIWGRHDGPSDEEIEDAL